jgi:2'-5' RNA ligase
VTSLRRTALVIVVPDAEPLVGDLRMRHDRMAALGVPAHVTVLHPFTPMVDDAIATRVSEVCQRLEPFDAQFTDVGRFPGGVVWLRPQPLERFVTMLVAVQAAFPDWPPYGGAFDEPVPHLTVASGADEATADELDRTLVERMTELDVVTSRVDRLTLLEEATDLRWTAGRSWPLGPT